MRTNPFISLSLILCALLLGCDRSQGGNAPPAAPAGVTATVSSPPPVAPSAAPQDASAKPDATGGSALTKDERNAKMPMAGQAGDHSTPTPVKRGDDTMSPKK